MLDTGLGVILIPGRPNPGDMEGTELNYTGGAKAMRCGLESLAHGSYCWILGTAAAR